MLKIQFKDKRRDAIWIVEKNYSLGRSAASNLRINDDSIDDAHARLVTENSKLFLKDSHSSTGSYVNEQRITYKEVLPGDVIRLGNVEIDILDPRESLSQPALSDDILKSHWKLVADSSWLSGQEYAINGHQVIIGRGNDCNIIIPGTHLSRQHAELSIRGNLLHIRDLASANGTFINEERITEGVARPGDRVRLDVYSFRVVGPPNEKDLTRVRRPSHQHFPQLNKEKPSTTAKNWQTKPTSPGNRVEAGPSRGSKIISAISILLFITMIAALTYLFIF